MEREYVVRLFAVFRRVEACAAFFPLNPLNSRQDACAPFSLAWRQPSSLHNPRQSFTISLQRAVHLQTRSDIMSISTSRTLRVVKRIIVSVIGGTVLLIGIALLVLPGPAFIVVPIGLAILATEYAWARHWLRKAREYGTELASKSSRNTQPPGQP